MRGGHRNRGKCDRCDREISLRTDGDPVAHKCPHGMQCVGPSYSKRGHHPRPECCIQADLKRINEVNFARRVEPGGAS